MGPFAPAVVSYAIWFWSTLEYVTERVPVPA
jgi:hypothetical protein